MQTAGPYRLQQRLSSCEVGDVWSGLDDRGKSVTVAVLNERASVDDRWRAAFAAAADALAQAGADQLPIVGSDYTGGRPWATCPVERGASAAQIFTALGQRMQPVAPAARPAGPQAEGADPDEATAALTGIEGAPGQPAEPGPAAARPAGSGPWALPPQLDQPTSILTAGEGTQVLPVAPAQPPTATRQTGTTPQPSTTAYPAQPTSAQPSPAHPSPVQPGPAQPISAQPSPVQPGPAQPISAQPSPVQPSPAQPISAQPGPAHPISAQPSPAHPISAQPGPAHPTSAQPGPTQPGPAQPGPGSQPGPTAYPGQSGPAQPDPHANPGPPVPAQRGPAVYPDAGRHASTPPQPQGPFAATTGAATAGAATAGATTPTPSPAQPYPGPFVPAPPAPRNPTHPTSGHPVSGHPSAGHPVSGHPSAGHPVSGHPTSGYPVSGQPAPGQFDDRFASVSGPGGNSPTSGYPFSPSPVSGGAENWQRSRIFGDQPRQKPKRPGLLIGVVAVVALLIGAAGGVTVMALRDGGDPARPAKAAPLTPAQLLLPAAAPSAPAVEPPVAGGWPASWPKFASTEATKPMNGLAGLGFNFHVPTNWTCTAAEQAAAAVHYRCGAGQGVDLSGGDLVVRTCEQPCDEAKRTALREKEEAWGLHWTLSGPFVTWAETTKIDDKQVYGLVYVAFWRSTAEGPIDRELVLRMTSPLATGDDLKKVANSIRDSTFTL